MEQRWQSETECVLRGVPIRHLPGGHELTNDERMVVLKPRAFFDAYAAMAAGMAVESVLEIGVFEGGSIALLADIWPTAKLVGIDKRGKNPAVLRHLERFNYMNRVKLYYDTGQDDAKRIEQIIASEFNSPLDIIIDDASHEYELTKRAFEITFPHLRAGGLYVIEDWAWAHWRGFPQPGHWQRQPALSNLVFELTMATASSRDVIQEVRVDGSVATIRKGVSSGPIEVDKLYATNGRRWGRL